jgi:hypothetical protein
MHGMDVCWFCQEPVVEPEEHDPLPAVSSSATLTATSVARAAVASTTFAVERPEPVETPLHVPGHVQPDPAIPPAPVVAASPPPATARRLRPASRVRKRRVLVLAVVFGTITAAGAVAWEASSRRNVPAPAGSVRFSSASLDGVGCDISYPDEWRLAEAKRHASFLSDERNGDLSLRGFRVTRTAIPLTDVRDEVVAQEAKFDTHEILSTEDATVGGRRAIKHIFLGDELRFEQWWVQRDKRSTIRLDLWSRPADDDALAVNARIVDSLDVK